MKKLLNTSFIILLLIFFSELTYSQTLSGIVYGLKESRKEPLEGAIIKWINTDKGVITDESGKFEISYVSDGNKKLVISYTGYQSDTIDVSDKGYIEVFLNPNLTTGIIEVEDNVKSTFFGNFTPKTEIITSQELVKDACCDLSGCFGRNSSVDVAVTDIIVDSKELNILGLEGVYTQILVDNMPVMTGLNTKFGVNSIPGTLIDKIMISKGSNSVLQGYESISGIINVLLKDYKNTDRFLFNLFVNSMLEKQFNLNFTQNFKRWNTIISGHSVQKSNRVDANGDGFLDNPLITRYMIYNKWNFKDKNGKVDFNIAGRFLNEQRVGGEKNFDISKDAGSSEIYGQTADINSFEGYSRFNYKLKGKKQIMVYASGFVYNQLSYYGAAKYDGKQKNLSLSGFYEFELVPGSFIKAGLSYKYQNIDENIELPSGTPKTYAGNYLKKESIAGLFAENSFKFLDEKASLMTGIRLDYHNNYKLIFTPRALLRFQPWELTVFRVTAGTGFRTVNLFSEHSNILASSRNIIFKENLNPEKTVNFGVDVIQYFDLGFAGGSINLDFYRTEFLNKIIPDYDAEPSSVIFSNLKGKSFSNVFQSEVSVTMLRNLELKLAYKYVELKYERNGVILEQPFNSKHRMLATLSYTTPDKQWSINSSLQWFGKQRLPSTQNNPPQYRRPDESEPYTLINAQVNKNFKFIELYVGAENLLNFRQDNPIISADNPFGPYFDTSFIWGPTKGREIYAGIRLILGPKK